MVFERIVCGVDGTEEGFVALRQARRLLAPEGRLVALTVCDLGPAAHAGWLATQAADELAEEAHRAQERARGELAGLAGGEALLVRGEPIYALLQVAGRERATLVAVGSHDGSRAKGILLGSVATTMLHDAPCSVLVARTPPDPEGFPGAIVVGLDGSPQSALAVAAATELGERLGAGVRSVLALGGKGADLEAARALVAEVEVDPRPPVDALADAARGADLVVVGSRGLHGLGAVGSVSERIAHRAACSVLVVRAAAAAPSASG